LSNYNKYNKYFRINIQATYKQHSINFHGIKSNLFKPLQAIWLTLNAICFPACLTIPTLVCISLSALTNALCIFNFSTCNCPEPAGGFAVEFMPATDFPPLGRRPSTVGQGWHNNAPGACQEW